MLKPGIHECAFTELHPILHKQLARYFLANTEIDLCYQKFWDGELSAFIVTIDKAFKTIYDNGAISTSENSQTEVVDLPEISSIVENEIKLSVFSPVYGVDLLGKHSDSSPRMRFVFLRKDDLYDKFVFTIKQKISEKMK